MMSMEQNRRATSRCQRRWDQQSRTVHVNQVGARLVQQRGDRSRLPGRISGELQKVGDGLASAAVDAGRKFVHWDTASAQKPDQRSAGRNSGARDPTALGDARKQVEQALLRAAKRAELIEKKDVHLRRTASASTHI